MIAYDTSGSDYFLTETNLGGGEGKLYSVEGNSSLYAKIFKPEKRTRGKEAKIRQWQTMFETGVVDIGFCKQVVVPLKALYSDSNPHKQNVRTFIGYLMEKQNDFNTLTNIYTEPDFDYKRQVWAARNLCILTNRVHSLGDDVVVGDYNADNVAVFMSTSTAKFIDVDSFQLTINGRRVLLPCTVGVPEFMAPEINRRLKKEKADLETVIQEPDNPIFTKYTDYYALAYHIFALLMNGSAPYASMLNMAELSQHKSRTVSSVDVDRFHAADKGEFVFARKLLFRQPPKYAPKYDILTPKLKELFERAFIEGASDPSKRPDSYEFFEALSEYIQMLERKPCGHYLSSHYNGSCEWCRIKKLVL